MFLQYLQSDPQYYITVIVVVVISITLHELAHGWEAMRRGDDTPVLAGHMTGNPLVHMGPFSLLALFIAGIAWGRMPVDSSRLRGRYADSAVAFAGPAMNLGLAFVSLTALGLWIRLGGVPEGNVAENARTLLLVGGTANLALFVFNLLPVPPLDGSRIVADFWEPYARWISNPANSGAVFFLFPVAFLFSRQLFGFTNRIAVGYLGVVAGF